MTVFGAGHQAAHGEGGSRCLLGVLLMRLIVALLALLCLAATPAGAATCTSQRNGNWGTANTWSCGRVPLSTDDAVISGNDTVTLNTNATVATLTVNNGTLRHTSSTGYALTVRNGLTVYGDGSVDSTGSGTLTITTTSVTNSGALAADVLNVTGNVSHTGNGSFAVGSLVFQGGGTQTADFYGSNARVTDLTVNAGTTLSSLNSWTLNFWGALTNNGSVSLSNATLVANGTSAQSMGGTKPVTLGSLQINNAAGLTLNVNLAVNNVLTLTSGVISAPASTVILDKLCTQGAVTGGSSSSYVDGAVQLLFPNYGINPAGCTFPLGSAARYAPVTVSYAWQNGLTGGRITGRTTSGDHPDTTILASGIDPAKSVNRYWTLTPEAGTNIGNYDATFQFCNAPGCGGTDVDAAANPNSFVVTQKAATTWATLTPSVPQSNQRKVAGLTGFGDFAIGERAASSMNCVSDAFAEGLDTSLWNVSGSNFTPQVVVSPTVPSSRLRLTSTGGNQSTYAQLKRWFPGGGNKVVVEFDYFGWGGSGADGIAVVLSDAGVAPSPGGYGGSMGYANRSGVNGFNGGWIGVGIDEYGNYPNPTEGRRGYPSGYVPPTGASVGAGAYSNSVAVRGSGSGQASGYVLLANTGTLSPALTTTNAVPQRYRLIIDHSNSVNAYVSVERDTGSGYAILVPSFDAKKANSGQAVVPPNFLLSFTGSTGGSTNNHEIGNVRVCATKMTSVSPSTPAANFECLETGSVPAWDVAARKPLYTKLVNTNFTFDVVALKTDGSVEDNFIAAGGNPKEVTVELFDDSATPAPQCSAYANPVATQSLQYISGDGGRKTLTASFNLSRASGRLRCRVKDSSASPTVYGCSSDTFTVRPKTFSAIASNANADSAGGSSASNVPAVKAGTAFSLTARTATPGYDGLPKVDASRIEWLGVPIGGRPASAPGILSGDFTVAASINSGDDASGSAFSYSEVGYFRFTPQGVFDDAFTARSGDATNGDCTDDASNSLVNGRYGCRFGNTEESAYVGRFIPNHFALINPSFTAGCSPVGAPGNAFSYMGQPFALSATVEAQNVVGVRTQNYTGVFAKASVSLQMENADSGVPLDVGRLGGQGGASWGAGQYLLQANQFSRLPTAVDGPFDALDIGVTVNDEAGLAAALRPYLKVRDMNAANTSCVVDLTGTSVNSNVCTATRFVQGARMRYGRIRLQNANGSELLPLPVPLQIQYWSGATQGWQLNAADTCTKIEATNFAFSFGGNLSACETRIQVGGAAPSYTATLSAPGAGNSGWADLTLNLGATGSGTQCAVGGGAATAAAPWLQFNWKGSVNNPTARATFGVVRSGPVIHRREVFR